jgi:peptidyl-prolyl cis-trans isomerase B (cyclophilin B)
MIKKTYFIGFALIMMSLGLSSCSSSTANNTQEKTTIETPQQKDEAPAVVEDEKPEQLVKISTDYGDMVVKLYNGTPLHRDNFIKLVKGHYYDGTLFHRVIKDFMIQGGDPDSKGAAPGQMLGNGGPGYTIPAEFRKEYFHKKGVIAAARESDNINPEKASSGSQFYIVQGRKWSNMELNTMEQQRHHLIPWEQKEIYMKIGGTPHLDGNYTVFGEVISGLNVIDSIAALPGDRMNRPLKDVKMTVTLIEE